MINYFLDNTVIMLYHNNVSFEKIEEAKHELQKLYRYRKCKSVHG